MMKGNEKISFTAEAVAFMRVCENSDRFSKYFVSEKAKKRFNLISKFIPQRHLDRIFQRRIRLSQDIDKITKSYNPEQIVELACGYSPRGLMFTQKNRKLFYIETDFPSTIKNKVKSIKEMEIKERIKLGKNHHFVNFDVLRDSFNKLKLNKNKKTLIIAEALVSYLDDKEHNYLMDKISGYLSGFKHGAYLSHESGFGMLNGFLGKLLLVYRNFISKTKSNRHFGGAEDIELFFKGKGFNKVKIFDSKGSGNIIYLAEK